MSRSRQSWKKIRRRIEALPPARFDGYCETQGKKRWVRQRDAKIAVKALGSNERESTIYRCPSCAAWHISRELRHDHAGKRAA